MGGTRSGTVGTPWSGATFAIRSIVAKRKHNGKVRQFKPSFKGKWDVLVSSTMQVSVGDQIRVTAGFREGKNVFKNNDIAQVREVTDTELVLDDGRRMRRNGARIDQGICVYMDAIGVSRYLPVVVYQKGRPDNTAYIGHPMESHEKELGKFWPRVFETTAGTSASAIQRAVEYIKGLPGPIGKVGVEASFLPLGRRQVAQ